MGHRIWHRYRRAGAWSWLAVAAVNTSSIGPSAEPPVSPGSFWSKDTRAAASCAIRTDRVGSGMLVKAAPGEAREQEALDRPTMRKCIDRMLLPLSSDSRMALAGQIAQRLYVGSVVRFSSRVIDVPGGLTPAMLNSAAKGTRVKMPKTNGSFDVVRCVVMKNPNFADSLLRTSHPSARENAALVAITQQMPTCLDQGQLVHTIKDQLRAEVARAHYQLLMFPGLP